jgi:tRNA-dihydrouridine synthase
MKPAALTIHARTQKEKSRVPAHWDVIKEISAVIKSGKSETVLIGNGDVKSIADAYLKAKLYGADGIMVGRGAMNNPWFFSGKDEMEVTTKERLRLLLKHARLYEKTFKGIKRFYNLRKFYSAYISNFSDAKKLRIELMKAQNSEQLEEAINKYLLSE